MSGWREGVGGVAEKLRHSVLGCRPCALAVALASERNPLLLPGALASIISTGTTAGSRYLACLFFSCGCARAYDCFFFKIATTSKVRQAPRSAWSDAREPEGATNEGRSGANIKQGQERKSERSDHFTSNYTNFNCGGFENWLGGGACDDAPSNFLNDKL